MTVTHIGDRNDAGRRGIRTPRGSTLLSAAAVLAASILPGPALAQDGRLSTAEIDSLRTELTRLNREYTQEMQRLIEKRRAEIEALQERMIEVRREMDTELQELTEVVRGTRFETKELDLEGILEGMYGSRPTAPQAIAREIAAWSGTAPIVLGQRAVAGAELSTLNPALGRYFGVESGVLVVDVASRSPAESAGLQPGDVIVEVDGEPVEAVEDVRRRFSPMTPTLMTEVRDGQLVFRPIPARDTDLSLRIIREGESVDLSVPPE